MSIKLLSSTKIGNFTLPHTDGASGQALITDGNGNISFAHTGGVTALSFANGVLTGTRAAGNITVNLDGRYALTGHDHSGVYDNYQSWNLKTNGIQRTTVQSGGTLDLVAGSNVTLSYGAGGVVTINATASSSGGTVTSVSGTGTVSGLTLSGTVTTSGSLTLGGTLTLTSAQVTSALGFTPYNATNPSGYITSSASISGNAATATTLQTARTINGTSFNGSANITTASWGTARTITIGSTGKSVDGSGNVSWTLAEIGAQAAGSYAAASHTHVWTDITNRPTALSSFTNDSGFITSSSSISGFSNNLLSQDVRTISPSSHSAYRLNFGFTSWANNNTSPYADYLHLRSYSDSSGGSDNLVMFKKSGIGMRIWQQSWGSATAYSSYADVWTSNDFTTTNVSNWNTAYGWGNHASAGYLTSASLSGYATQAYVNTAVANVVNSAPAALDTLNELAAALGNDASFSTTISTSLGNRLRVDTAAQGLTGTQQSNARTNLGLGTAATSNTGDFATAGHTHSNATTGAAGFMSAADKSKLDGIASGATANAGTVTSISGTGGYGGLTLSGTVTSSGSLTLGGTPTGTWPIAISGNAATASSTPLLTSSGSFTSQYGSGTVGYVYAVTNPQTGLFPASDNSNSILTVNRHPGDYYSQLGFSSNGNLYYRNFVAAAINTSQAWQTIWTSSSLTNLNQLTNGPGYTSNTGTVTSVSGTGTVSGLTLSGTVTGSGSLTLGGTLSLTSANVTGALGYTPYNSTNPSGYITGITSGMVTSALGFTPYNSSNPSGYITSSGSISGSSGSVSGLTLNNSGSPINPDNVTQNQIGYNTSVSLFGQTDGGLYSSAYSSSWIHQIYGDFRSGQIAVRGKNNGSWQAWRVVLDSSNYTSYAAAASHTHTPSQVGLGNVSNDAQVTTTYNTSLNSDSRNSRGVTRLYRRDSDSDYSVQTYWTGSYWRLYGYNGDSGHADTHVGYADSAGYSSSTGSVAWGNVSGRPTNVSSFTNDSGYITSGGSISGSSRLLAHVDGPRNLSDRSPNWNARTATFDFVGAGTGNGSGNYAGILTFVPWDGTTASTGDSSYQLSFANQSGVNASGPARLSIRNGINSTWNSWQEILTSSNYNSYSPTLTGGNASGTWGINITGNAATASSASSVAWSNVSSKPGNLTYWDTWYGSAYLGSDGNLYMGWAGAWLSSWFNQSVKTDASPTFAQVYNNGWFRNYGRQGLYNQDYGNHWYAHSDSYWTLAGNNGSAVGIMFRSGGHEGTLRGYVYADSSNQIGFLNSGGSWSLRCDNSGNVTATGDLTAYSDARIKTEVKTVENALDKVLALRGVTYKRKDIEDKSTKIGVIAQEVREVLPEVVSEKEDGILTVSYGNMVGVLIEAMKEQQQIIETLEAKIELLTKYLK